MHASNLLLAVSTLLAISCQGAPVGRKQATLSRQNVNCPRSFSRVVSTQAYGVDVRFSENWDLDEAFVVKDEALICSVRAPILDVRLTRAQWILRGSEINRACRYSLSTGALQRSRETGYDSDLPPCPTSA